MIFVSTGGERLKTAFETASYFIENEIYGVELSGGKFSPTYLEDLLSLSRHAKLQVHNYFPPPADSFVLNLASADPLILKNSISHVKRAIQLAVLLDRPVYSFHAGFRINPKVKDLGGELGQSKLTDRAIALEIFGDSILSLSEEARREGVSLLIENNVLSKANLLAFGQDPLLLTAPGEISTFMKDLPLNVGLLLDVAHLKVSGKTLGFNLIEAHESLRSWIRGYHLSDNDGLEDSNEPVNENSWFWHCLNSEIDNITLEVYGRDAKFLLDQQKLVTKKINDLVARKA
jgi:sugar phosphate isomerase/epimerase